MQATVFQKSQGGGEDGDYDAEDGEYSTAAKWLLARRDGSMPNIITKLDVKIVNLIVSEVIQAGAAVQWTEIAGTFPRIRILSDS